MPQKPQSKPWEKIFSIDTNILLDNALNLIQLSQSSKNLVVIPETVIDEIDSKKTGFDEINFQARSFGRLLFDAKIIRSFKEGHITIIETEVQGCTIYIISKEEYKADSNNVSNSIRNDRKILEITKEFRELNGWGDTIFLSLDVMARTRAISLGIPAESLNLGVKDEKLEFIKYVDISDKGIEVKNGTNIEVYDPEHKPENFSYVLTNNGRDFLCSVINGKIELLEEKDLRKQSINPMNTEQLFFSNAMLNPYYNICIADAIAGSGKTLLAVSAAIELVRDKNTQYNKIVYIRNSIESLAKGEDVGYLSGNTEKFEIYNFPLFDTLAFIANKLLKCSKENKPGKGDVITEEKISEKVQELVGKYQIQTMWPGSMRGRTISNSVVIVDEAQNCSNSTLQLISSRIDESCKLIILGSNRQIDNQYLTKYTNGLTTLLNSCREKHNEVNLFGIELTKVLRGPITAFAEKVFSKKD